MMKITEYINSNLIYRFLARQVDYTILFFLFLAAKDLSVDIKEFCSQHPQILYHLALLFLWTFIEAGLLLKFNTTLGKKIFGIKVVTDTPSYKRYLVRSLEVFIKGMGFGLPIVSSFTAIYFYVKSYKTSEVYWDKKLNFKVEQSPINLFVRLLVLALVSLGLVTILSLLIRFNTVSQEIPKPPLETMVVDFPSQEEENFITINDWVKYCTSGAIKYASKNTYILKAEDLQAFCEAQGKEFFEEELGLVAKQQACGYGLAYAYSQINKASLEALEEAIENPIFFEMELKKNCQDPEDVTEDLEK